MLLGALVGNELLFEEEELWLAATNTSPDLLALLHEAVVLLGLLHDALQDVPVDVQTLPLVSTYSLVRVDSNGKGCVQREGRHIVVVEVAIATWW